MGSSEKRKRIFEIIEKADEGDRASAICDWFIIVLVFLNIVAVITHSFDSIQNKYNKLFIYFEYFSITIFTIEYLLRAYTSKYKFPNKTIPFLAYIVSPMAIIDLCAILPFYIPFIIKLDLRSLRIFRLFRLLRILKINRYNKSLELIIKVLKKEKDKLFMTIFISFVMLLLASSLMYYFENTVQPDKFPNIPATLWWAIATLTTVGYGDVYPVTALGKILSGVIALLGIGLVALPSGIISSGLMKLAENEKQNEKKEKNICPHCGKEII